MLLCGNNGTGKSKLMHALSHVIANYNGSTGKIDSIQPFTIISARELARLYGSKVPDDLHRFENLKKAYVLGIDDIGDEEVTVKNYGTNKNPVIDILLYRYDMMKVTILTTNLSMDSPDKTNILTIRKTYGERIYDRMCEMYDRIVFNFKSFRQM